MRNLFIVACLMSVGFDSMATVGNHIFICNVAKVGKDQVQLACDPKNPKMVMKTPRKWLDPEDKVALKSKAKFILDNKEFDEWLAMNGSATGQKGKKP